MPSLTLNARQERFLAALGAGAAATRAEYQAAVPCSVRTAKRDLAALQAAGLLQLEGASTASRYRLVPKGTPMREPDIPDLLVAGYYRALVEQADDGTGRILIYSLASPDDNPRLLLAFNVADLAVKLRLRVDVDPPLAELARRQIAAREAGWVPEPEPVPAWLEAVPHG